eukprot:TRINITY_DN50750_c0_g1_i1.p1 TRINITY_DN50750_c0_g1~~TRINITY_DN50750_c0_g1_i1.p1  ORF type:complete len:178 (-),score=25.60 TRINITY_DN50750_c0_g1_i1:71-604(-)
MMAAPYFVAPLRPGYRNAKDTIYERAVRSAYGTTNSQSDPPSFGQGYAFTNSSPSHIRLQHPPPVHTSAHFERSPPQLPQEICRKMARESIDRFYPPKAGNQPVEEDPQERLREGLRKVRRETLDAQLAAKVAQERCVLHPMHDELLDRQSANAANLRRVAEPVSYTHLTLPTKRIV